MSLNVAVDVSNAAIDGLTVRGYAYADDLSGLFELTLELAAHDPAVDLRSMLGTEVTVQLRDEPLLPEVSGILCGGRQLSARPDGASLYELVVRPPLWLTTRRRDHRIFQDRSSVAIVSDVLGGYAGAIAPLTLRLSSPPPAREYCVEYGETDHDFVSRILAEDGITSFFDHAAGSAFTLLDDTTVQTAKPPVATFAPPAGVGQVTSRPHVLSVVLSDEVETSAYGVRDFDPVRPALLLSEAASISPGHAALERYEYAVGSFASGGQRLARQLLEEANVGRRTLRCQTSFALAPGSRFTIVDHPRDEVNGDVLVVGARCRVRVGADGKAERSHCLTCIPAGTPFRPPRRAKPRIHGTQTAMVVGEDGEEIHVDESGRVKVAFRWDRRDPTSGSPTRYVRVSQGWAGAGMGLLLLPRVKDEVVLAYLDGDPDQPLVVGRVHNGAAPAPLRLPAEKTRSIWKSQSSPGGGGANSIMMEDQAGAELLEMRAQLDMQTHVGRDAATSVSRSSSRSTGLDDSTQIGNDQTCSVGANQSTSVGGNQKVGVGGNQTVSVGGNQAVSVAANQTTTATNIAATGSASVALAAPTFSATGSATATVTGSMVFVSGGAVVGLTSGGSLTAVAPVLALEGATLTILGSGTVTIHAPAVTVSGDKVNVAGGAEVNVSAPTVNVTGEGEVNIKGGVVKIG